MAVLTSSDLTGLRQSFEKLFPGGVALKAQLNAGLQAIEDWFESNRAGLGSAIDAATAPVVLTAQQKKALAEVWLLSKFNRGG